MPIVRISSDPSWAPANSAAGVQVRSLEGGVLSGELLDAYGVRLPSSRSVSVVLRAVTPSGCAANCHTAVECLPDGSFTCTAAAGLSAGLILGISNAKQGLIEIPGPNLTLAGVYLLALQASVTILLPLPSFTVFPAPASALVLPRCPVAATLEVVFAPSPLVSLVDRFGNILWLDSASVVTAQVVSPSAYSLHGLSRTRLQNGTATFWNIAASAVPTGGSFPTLILNFSTIVDSRPLAVLSNPMTVQTGSCWNCWCRIVSKSLILLISP